MTSKKKLFLLDAYALIYRAFFAFIKNPRVNSKGLDTSAIFGFANTLVEVITKEGPTHIAVVFDRSGPTFRHVEFSEYKANREPTPDGILSAIPYIERMLNAMNISILYIDGYEADDVIGTIAKKAEKKEFNVYMMTPDKDFAQLVSKNIFMYRPGNKWSKSQIWGVKEVLEKFEIKDVSQVIDYLGMMGDAVDNIPGIPGVGERTAKKFINEYGSIESLFDNTDKIKGKLRKKVEDAKDQAILSKRLATIEVNAPIDFEEEKLRFKKFKIEELKSLLEELEFKTILPRILSISPGSEDPIQNNSTKNLNNEGQLDMFSSHLNPEENKFLNRQYIVVKEQNELINIYDKIIKEERCSFQILSEVTGDIIGVSLSYEEGKSFYIPFSIAMIEFLKKIFLNTSILKIGFNIKEQIKTLKKHKINKVENIFDVSIAHYLLEPDMRHDIEILSQIYLNYEKLNIEELLGKGINRRNFSNISEEEIRDYCCEQADIHLQLSQIFTLQLKENDLFKLFNNIEMPLVDVLQKMELEGINLDTNILLDFSKKLSKDIEKIEGNIYNISGEKFNLSSPKQMGEVLFDKMKISEKVKKTKTGQHSTSEETLSKLKGIHPIIEQILEYRSLEKLLYTYVNALPLLVDKKTNRIHTTFNQSVAATGRLSSINPNLQNIPIRTDNGRKIRVAFISKNEEYKILAADYSQIELRIMADLSQDPSMLHSFNNFEDIHLSTAAKVYNVQKDAVTREMRSNAKMVNFGIIYGISPFGLSQRLGIKRKEAAEIIDQYFLEFPKVKEYIEKTILKAQKQEYVETSFGRKRYLKNINSGNMVVRKFAERNAINAPIQGLAADIIKKAMISVQKDIELYNLKSKMILQVHDELVFDMKKEEEEILTRLVKENMENAIKLNVPLVVDIGIGDNWLEAHQ